MNGVDVAGDAADQVAGLFLIVIRERQALDMRVKRAPQVVHHPLADAGGEILFGVGANCVHESDGEHGDGGKLQNRQPIGADGGRISGSTTRACRAI